MSNAGNPTGRGFAAREIPKPLLPEELIIAEYEVRTIDRRPGERRAISTEAAETTCSPASKPLESGLHLLLVEDNPINQRLAVALLEKQKHRVDIAVHGQEALEMLETTDFDLILMDVQMPVLDGLEATRQWRKREQALQRPRLPIVAMTANAMAGDRDACLNAGMDGYISKPINIVRLNEEIQRVLRANQRQP